MAQLARVSRQDAEKVQTSHPPDPGAPRRAFHQAAFSHRSEAQRVSEVGITEGLFRSPRPVTRANGPHEVRFVRLWLFTRCGLARGTARLGAPGSGG
jgi:hypothetical protein